MRRLVLAFVLLSVSATAAALDFTRFYGRDAVVEGRGGEMRQIEGVDYWTNGDPPRRYEVIGYIEDRRHATGLVGKIRLKSLPEQVARMAKANGADAVVLVSADDQVVGFATNANVNVNPYGNSAYGNQMTVPVAKRESRFAVVRYLPDKPESGSN